MRLMSPQRISLSVLLASRPRGCSVRLDISMERLTRLVGPAVLAGFTALACGLEPEAEPCEHTLSPESDVLGKAGQAFDGYDPSACVPDEQA